MYLQQKLETFSSAVCSMHYTPRLNMCVSGIDNGEILFMDPKELHYEYVLERKFGERRLLLPMDIKKLDGKPITRLITSDVKSKNNIGTEVSSNKQILEEEFLLYDPDYKEKYGLVFQPMMKVSYQCYVH